MKLAQLNLKSFSLYYKNMERVRFTKYTCNFNSGHSKDQLRYLTAKLNQGGFDICQIDDKSTVLSLYDIKDKNGSKVVGHLTIDPYLIVVLDIYGSNKLEKIAKNFKPLSVFK
jgi:hypothetical protein